MPCTYFADNGQPSILFDRLFSYYKGLGNSDRKAELMAVTSWLATRTEGFMKFAGNWKEDSTQPRTITIDKNGEPEITYMGESDFFSNLPLTDYKSMFNTVGWDFTPTAPIDTRYKLPAFLSLKNPKVVNVGTEFTKDDFYKEQSALRDSTNDGIVYIHTAEDGTTSKHYVVKDFKQVQLAYEDYSDKINTSFNKPVDQYYLKDIESENQVTEPVVNFVLQNDRSFRILQSLTQSDNPNVSKLSRAVLVKAGKSLPVSLMEGTGIAYNDKQLMVGKDMQMSRSRFDIVMTTEIMQSYIRKGLEEGEESMTPLQNLYTVSKRLVKGYPEYMKSADNFMHGFFTDRGFYQHTKDIMLPGSQTTMQDALITQIGEVFGFRSSYRAMLDKIIQEAAVAKQRSNAVLYEKDVPGEDNNQEEKAPEVQNVNPKAPYAHLMTGDPTLDKYIAATFEKIQGIRSRIQKRGKQAENVTLKVEMAKYQKELNSLVESRTIAILINVGQREIMRMKNALQRELSHKEIGENLNLLDAWRDFSSLFDTTDADANTLYNIRHVALNALELYNTYKDLYWNSVKTAMMDEGLPIQYVEQISPEQVIEDIGKATANFIGLSFAQNGLEVGADFIIRRAAYNINNELIDFEHRLKEKLDKLGSKDISFMFYKDTTGRYRPLTKYRRELYEEVANLNKAGRSFITENKYLFDELRELRKQRSAATIAGDKATLEQINKFIKTKEDEIEDAKSKAKTFETLNEFMRKNFDYSLSDQGKADYAEFADRLKEAYYNYNPETNELEFNELSYLKALEDYNPEKLTKWLETGTAFPRFAQQWFAVTPKAEWLDTGSFAKLSDSQKEFYDFFVDEYLKGQANIPMDYSFSDYDADKLLMEFAYMDTETMGKMKYLAKEAKDFIKDIATVPYYERQISADQTAPLSKTQVRQLRFKPVSDFIKGTEGYYKEGDELPESLQKGLEEGRYKYKDGYLVINSQGKKNEQLVQKIITVNADPLDIFRNFRKFSYAYQYKREVEDVLNGIRDLSYASPKEAEKNRGVTNLLGKRIGSAIGSNLEGRLNYTIESFLHGTLKDPLAAGSKAKPGERVWSGEKMIESLNNLTRARQLGLNVASGVTNLAMGTIGNFVFAGRDEFFNEKELRSAYAILRDSVATFYSVGQLKVGNSRKIALLLQKFNLLGNMREQLYVDKQWAEKAFEKLFILQEKGEYMNQGAVLISMMLREKIEVDGKKISLWNAFEEKDGKLEFKYPESEYADLNKQFVFGEAVKKIVKEVHGDYDPLNPMYIKKGLWGRVGMMFRTWLPQAVKQRVGKKYTDYQLSMLKGEDVWREGRWKTLGSNLFMKGSAQDKIQNIGKFLGAMLTSTISNNAGRKIINTMKIDEQDRFNMYANMKEIWWLVALSTATSLLISSFKGAGDDDPDKTKMSWLRYIYNQSSRVENELWFFYSPRSFSQIVRDAIPMYATLKQAFRTFDAGKNFIFDHPADTYKRGFRKGDSKFATQLELFFPIAKQVQSIWSMTSSVYSNNYY